MPLNTLIDALDTANNCATPAEKWAAYAKSFAKIGSPFFTIGEGDTATGEVLALQTTLSHAWFDHYYQQNYQSVDPHVPQAGRSPALLTESKWLLSQRDHLPENSAPLVRNYYDDIAQSGYSAAVGIPCPLPGSPNLVRVVVIGAGLGDEAFIHSEEFRILTMLAPIAALEAMPLEEGHPDLYLESQPRLSPREKDVLCLLATGHMNARIAEKLKISEVTVRMHMTSARRKLGCSTRDQAMAVAMVRGLIQI